MRFSIVITAYNQIGFIRDAVDSALTQPTSDREIIVVDDASQDGSGQVLKGYGNAIHLASLKENKGAIGARNYGASLATGEYIVFLDGDDALMPWALAFYERIIQERRPMLILARRLWIEGAIPPVTDDLLPHKAEFVEYDSPMSKDRPVGLSASAFIVDRQAFQDAGGWTPANFYQDIPDIVTKLGYSGRMILVDQPYTVFYRIHSGNSIHSVLPFVRTVHSLLESERAGRYPGGRAHRFERYAWLGGIAFYWTKRGLKAGYYKDSLNLAMSGLPMILAGTVRRLAVRIKGRHRVESIDFKYENKPTIPVANGEPTL
jgi:glycosyltransferase involved in cell wall biosynthesis